MTEYNRPAAAIRNSDGTRNYKDDSIQLNWVLWEMLLRLGEVPPRTENGQEIWGGDTHDLEDRFFDWVDDMKFRLDGLDK